MSTGRRHHCGHLLQVQKESFQPLSLYTSFHDLIMYIPIGQGQVNPRGQNFDVNRNLLSLRSFVACFKKFPLKSDFKQFFFHEFLHVYSPRAGADSPQATKFWCQQKCFVTSFICCKFQRNLFEVWCYIFFSWFNTCTAYIAPGQGQTDFDVNRKALSFYLFVASFKEISLKSDFIHFFFSWFNTCM